MKQKKNINKTFDKIEELEIELLKIKYFNIPNLLESKLKEFNKIQVVGKNLQEIKNKILRDYAVEFRMVRKLTVVDQITETHMSFRNITDYEVYINSIDDGYDAEDATCNSYIYKISTLQFNLVNRSQYRDGCVFKHEILEYRGNNCFVPTKRYCFIKYINFITCEDYKKQYLDFIRNERRRSNILNEARIQSFCRANNIIIGFFDGTRVFP